MFTIICIVILAILFPAFMRTIVGIAVWAVAIIALLIVAAGASIL